MLGAALFGQRRFAEALAAMKESGHLNPAAAQVYAGLASCYGHLGDAPAAKAALDEMSHRTTLTVREMGEQMYRAQAQRTLFLEGVAKIEGAVADR
jgi:predicted Zn-dependent protease